MKQGNRATKVVSVIALLTAIVFHGSGAVASIGDASLIVAGATSTPTHWNIPIGVPTVAQLCGVTTAEAGDPLPATITVWVKHSWLGNQMVTATWIGGDCYEFSYTPPAVANGDDFDACDTSIIAYLGLENNANNDVCDDGLDNGSQDAACGFRYVDDQGNGIDCDTVAATTRAWGHFKVLYR